MTAQRHPRRTRQARRLGAPPTDGVVGAAADGPDAPDSVGAAESVEAVAPARRDEHAGDVERDDARESGSMEAVVDPEEGSDIPGFVESQAGAGEDGACQGDPWH
jgi:hypothetical protein